MVVKCSVKRNERERRKKLKRLEKENNGDKLDTTHFNYSPRWAPKP